MGWKTGKHKMKFERRHTDGWESGKKWPEVTKIPFTCPNCATKIPANQGL